MLVNEARGAKDTLGYSFGDNAPGLIIPLRPNLGVLQIGIRAKVIENQLNANGQSTSQQQKSINTDMRRDIVDPYTVGTAGASERRINNNYRAKEQLSKAKDQNSNTDPEGQTMGKRRIHFTLYRDTTARSNALHVTTCFTPAIWIRVLKVDLRDESPECELGGKSEHDQ
ncbi:hypothetical protein Tco_1124010 [Tanacetum coccineum]|uniref:Uncharacterized protein n=1 Tax=Tanacetum coccineum TaxID=301880 RepID=A0ABQ5J6N9_9ASTR